HRRLPEYAHMAVVFEVTHDAIVGNVAEQHGDSRSSRSCSDECASMHRFLPMFYRPEVTPNGRTDISSQPVAPDCAPGADTPFKNEKSQRVLRMCKRNMRGIGLPDARRAPRIFLRR